jgi:hypothetical protein
MWDSCCSKGVEKTFVENSRYREKLDVHFTDHRLFVFSVKLRCCSARILSSGS